MSKIERTWEQSETIAYKNNFWRNCPYEEMNEYLVELTTNNRDDFTVTELVTASSIEHAIWCAFQTRNMPDNWLATEVEEFGE